MKKVFLYLTLLCSVVLMSGCSETASELAVAYNKTAALKSYETKSELRIKLDAELSEEILEQNKPFNVQSLLNALSDFTMSTTGKRYENSKGEYKGVYKFNVTAPDSDTVFSGYEYGNKEGGTVVAYIPTMLRALLPAKYEDSRYVEFSSDEFAEIAQRFSVDDVFNTNFVTISSEYSESVLSIMKEMFNKINVFDVLSKKKNVYTFTLTDELLKSGIRNIVTEYYQNPDFRKHFKEIYDNTREYYKNIYGEEYVETFLSDDIEFEPAESELEEALAALDAFENVKLIGDDGINISFTKNNRGYISEIKAAGTFIFDSGEIDKINFGEEFYDGIEKYSFGFEYVWEMSSANAVKNFSLPEFEKESCVSIYDWINEYKIQEEEIESEFPVGESFEEYMDNHKDSMVLPAEDGSITYFDVHDMKITFDIPPVIRDGVTYVADTEIEKFFRWEYLFAEKEDEAFKIYVGGKYPLYVYPDIKEFVRNEYKIIINNAPFFEGGVLYLPFKDFVNIAYDASVIWNEDEKSVTVQY